MTRHLARRTRVAVAAALLAPAMLWAPAAAQAATSPAATGHLPAPNWDDDPDGQWWDYKEPSESASGQDDNQQARAAKTQGDESKSGDEADEAPNRRSLPDESSERSGDSAKPAGSGEKEELFGANEPKSADAPKGKSFDDNLERVQRGRNSDVPKDAGNAPSKERSEKPADTQTPIKDPYDNPDYVPPAAKQKDNGEPSAKGDRPIEKTAPNSSAKAKGNKK